METHRTLQARTHSDGAAGWNRGISPCVFRDVAAVRHLGEAAGWNMDKLCSNNDNNNNGNDDDSNNTNNNNNHRIQRHTTISSLPGEPSPTRTLKWTGRNRVEITCNTSSPYYVQHVLRATQYEGTAQLLSLTEFK